MKWILSLLIGSAFFSGCATPERSDHDVPTFRSDLHPSDMTRDQYYEEMGKAYASESDQQRAVEDFRLSLLHNPQRVSARIALSDEYRKLQMNQLAAFELNEAIRLEPKNTEAMLKLGDLYLSAQIYSKAKELFEKVLTLEPQNEKAKWLLFYLAKLDGKPADAERSLGQITPTESNKVKLLYEKALLAKEAHRDDEFSQLISQAYEFDPHDRNICLEMKNRYLKSHDYDSALVVLRHYADAHDFDFEVSENLVYTAVLSENYDLAQSELDHQKEFADPVQVELRQAHVSFLAEDLPLAERRYKKVLQQNPDSDEAKFYLGQIYAHQDQDDAAFDLFKELPASSGYFADAQVWLAHQESREGHREWALKRMRQALMQRPDQFVLYKSYADFLIEEKKYKLALKVLKTGIEFFPDSEDLQIRAAVAFFQTGQEDRFKKAVDRAVAINPLNAEIYSSLAELWYIKKTNPQQIQDFAQKALDYKTKNQNIKPILAWALLTQDRSKASVAMFEKFYEENPNQPFFAEALAQIYEAADINIRAQKMSQQALKLQNQQRLQSDLQQRQPASQPSP
jgi:tetratricopeptide (TPR) repeat protein